MARSPAPRRPFPDAGRARPNNHRKTTRPAPRPAGLPPRRAAIDVSSLIHRGATLDEALKNCRSYAALEGPDRAFARLLVTTMLRYRGALDEVIGQYLNSPLPPRAREAQDILRLAGAQILFVKTPAHAAVSTAVALCEDKRELSGYKGLLNAVARKIAEDGPRLLKKQPLRTNTPGWMWRSWARGFGPAAPRRIAEAHQRRAPLDLTVKSLADRDPLAREILTACATERAENIETNSGMDQGDPGISDANTMSDVNTMPEPRSAPPVEVTALGPATLRLRGFTGAIDRLPGYAEGRWWVQDLSASIPAHMMGPLLGKTVYDLCAAPGGKTAQLANMGAQVTAIDISQSRLDLLQETLTRLDLSADLIAADVLDWAPERLADYVLLDAPCSATGTIRRHPDILWYRTEEDVDKQSALQSALIDRALALLKPGGICVYATCSLQQEEGELQIKQALERHSGLAVAPLSGLTSPDTTPLKDDRSLSDCFSKQGMFRAFPFHNQALGGMDGFFAAAILKSE